MTIRYISIVFIEEDDDLSYSLEFASNDESVPDIFSFFLLALDILYRPTFIYLYQPVACDKPCFHLLKNAWWY